MLSNLRPPDPFVSIIGVFESPTQKSHVRTATAVV